MGRPSGPEIEKFFAVKRSRILADSEEKLNHMLGQVRLTGNIGGYLPAHIKWGKEQVEEMILAFADAQVEAFTSYGVPCDTEAEGDLKAFAQLTTAGTTSNIRGRLQRRSTTLRTADEGSGVPWHLDIERAMSTALDEGLLRLKKQHIKFRALAGARLGSESLTSSGGPGATDIPGPSNVDPPAGFVPAHRADWREDAAFALECPPLLRPVSTARLDAIAVLRKEAASSVQSSLPQTKEALEQCLWPSLGQYAQTVFDKMAESRLKSGRRSRSSKAYAHWLRSKCSPAVIDDVCQPIAGQYPTTIRLIVETIGDRHSQTLDITKRALWEMVALAIGGPFTENLRKCLIAHLENRIPHWQAVASSRPTVRQIVSSTKTASKLRKPDSVKAHAQEPPHVGPRATQRRLGARLKNLKRESNLPWRTIAKESGVSYRWLHNISSGSAPSAETRKKIRDYFSRVLGRHVRF